MTEKKQLTSIQISIPRGRNRKLTNNYRPIKNNWKRKPTGWKSENQPVVLLWIRQGRLCAGAEKQRPQIHSLLPKFERRIFFKRLKLPTSLLYRKEKRRERRAIIAPHLYSY